MTEVRGTLGIVVLIEEIAYVEGLTVRSGFLATTNVFEHDGKERKMIHHHGSPLPGNEEGGESRHYFN
ncbi:MAG: hypothetical protein HW407_806 [Bacteroidetes bacterium]|nr:hypothetical protein [Bacteroidota bacterium]